MNIFAVHSDPNKAAQMLCDKHVVKMPLETAQMLVTSLVQWGLSYSDRPRTQSGNRYKCTHHNHPCTVWAGLSQANFRWLCDHGLALCDEYQFRYDRQHACRKVIDHCATFRRQYIRRGDGLLPFVKAMPDDCKHGKAVSAYRRYYLHHKYQIATWDSGRPAPLWWRAAV